MAMTTVAVTVTIIPGAPADAAKAPRRRYSPHTTHLLTTQHICCIFLCATSQELKRWLAKQGCTFEPGRGGHLTVRLGDKVTDLPMHGNKRDLPTGTVQAIKRALGLK
jgi:mRNA interferase HicA